MDISTRGSIEETNSATGVSVTYVHQTQAQATVAMAHQPALHMRAKVMKGIRLSVVFHVANFVTV